MLGMPVVGLATAELSTVVRSGVSGYVDTDPGRLVEAMRRLLDDAPLARELGEGARRRAGARFSIARFRRDWDGALAQAMGRSPPSAAPRPEALPPRPGGTRAAVGAGR